MGASIHLCRGEGPRDPVEPGGGDRPEPAPDRGGPCRNLIQDFHDKAINLKYRFTYFTNVI